MSGCSAAIGPIELGPSGLSTWEDWSDPQGSGAAGTPTALFG